MRTTAACRDFTDAPVEAATLHRVLDRARFAPSGGNAQGWRVIVVDDRAKREQLAALCQPTWNVYMAMKAAGERPFQTVTPTKLDVDVAAQEHVPNPLLDVLPTAPVVLVVVVDLTLVAAMDAELDRVGVIGGASVYPFCHNVLLSARNEGLGGVMTTFLGRAEADAQAVLGVPSDHAVAAMIVLGHPVKQVTKLGRKPVEAFTTMDAFDGDAFSAG